MVFMKYQIPKEFFLFDESFPKHEQLPRRLSLQFTQTQIYNNSTVTVNKKLRSNHVCQVGDAITDNSYDDDGYRYHDIFHLSYAAILGWSPVLRQLLKLKRKSNPKIDEVEDGARASIAEEGISLMVFEYSKKNNFFDGTKSLDIDLYKHIKLMISSLEVRHCTYAQWEQAILQGYQVYRLTRKNEGGIVYINLLKRKISYRSFPKKRKD